MELASFVTSSVLLQKSWGVITSRYAGIISIQGEGLSWKIYEEPDPGLTIIAFEVMQQISSNHQDSPMVPSRAFPENIFYLFDFLFTKKTPFSVNKTAISLCYENYEKLAELLSEANRSHCLIVTGHALGGPIASLFTLALTNSIDHRKKLPLCITFGSPLVGDKTLQEAISLSSTWNSCFLHVVSSTDQVCKILNPHTSAYMPFGTFLFCSEINSTCFESPESALKLLVRSINDQNQEFQPIDYGKIVENLYNKAICKDFTPVGMDLTHPNSPRISIFLQLCAALGLTPDMKQQQQQNTEMNTLAIKMEKLEEKFVCQKRMKFYSSKLLNEVFWSRHRNIGYYDSYKNMDSQGRKETVELCKMLRNHWEKMVEEAFKKGKRGYAVFQSRWLYAAYMRMVEPLAIAEYYIDGGKYYVNNRPKHFLELEQWLDESTKEGTIEAKTGTLGAAILTPENSCYFLECIEKALVSRQ
ncbi:unnamed protein product [Sphenostylis stenocarpa]|uniref:Uncharacterized protein n=1 Tax=Sphenostylis stenocarpa TaxID=92480 RepID=A0AA86SAR1_9FABA|nr:unnamed protein product [Sphenostylis stenocarpa]